MQEILLLDTVLMRQIVHMPLSWTRGREPMKISKDEKILAGFVALRVDDWQPEHGCPAWIESRDRQCGRKPLDDGMLCKRHRTVAVVRRDKALAARQHQAQQLAERRARMLPEWKAELERVEADMERYGGMPTTDRAAYGGVSHPSIRKAQLRQLSDTNVQRMARLSKRAQELISLIGDDG